MGALLLAGTALPLAAREEPPPPSEELEAFTAGGASGILALPAGASDRQTPAVLILHDALGPDGRTSLYTDQLLGAGLAVLDLVTLHEESLDAVLAALATHPRLAGQPVGLLGFGLGARHAARSSGPVAARALLYPGCAGLAPVAMRGEAVLLLRGAADPANETGACTDLAQTLATAGAAVRHRVLPDATYAWDRPASAVEGRAMLPRPDGPGRVVAEAWPELAAVSATEVAWFFVSSFRDRRP
jgi:dienelactone hydrolase